MVRPTPNLNSKITLYLHFEQFGKKIELNKKKKNYTTEHNIIYQSLQTQTDFHGSVDVEHRRITNLTSKMLHILSKRRDINPDL